MTAAHDGRAHQPERALFEIPDDVTYLNCASMSPQLRTVTAAGIDAVRSKASPWTLRASDWFVHAEPLRALFGRVIGADAESVALVPSVSYGLAVAAANVPVRAGQSIVVLDREFPSGTYTWRELARRTGARIVTVAREAGASWTDALIAALDPTVALVATPVCHWTDGSLVDLERLAPAVRAVGAALVIDASQAAGAHPIDVSRIQPDFLCAVGYKWLLGPYSLGYLYVDPKWHARGVPIEQTWMSRAGAEDFTSLVDYVEELRPGARRFDMGEFSQFTLLPMSVAAVTQVLEWGVPRIAAGIGAITSRIAEEAVALGCEVPPNSERVAHIVGVKLPRGLPSGLTERLAQARVFVSVRGDSIRVAPHLYNDENDVARFVKVLGAALR
ncbi:MAG TPA: aminotransferase class V-fold PLP-dependent enzyme [Gemmatimonadaceae bacterium]|nr:aminotransferase class V-fold PLP-dependent enzyme [Gemmatimonadaceae bacterium]